MVTITQTPKYFSRNRSIKIHFDAWRGCHQFGWIGNQTIEILGKNHLHNNFFRLTAQKKDKLQISKVHHNYAPLIFWVNPAHQNIFENDNFF